MAIVGEQKVHEGAVRDDRQAPLRARHQPLYKFAPAVPDLVMAFPAVPLPIHILLFLNLHQLTYLLTS